MHIRSAFKVLQGMPASDGAGVKLTRIIGTPMLDHINPVLLLDEFKSENPDDYIAGFPPHPHRGFETITYMKHGHFKHQDSAGNTGYLGPGSIQWMTAGRGIIHSEMPEMKDGLLWGYQLWLNLPAKLKMSEPKYHDIEADQIPVVESENLSVVVLAGDYLHSTGPGKASIPFTYLDVSMRADTEFDYPTPMDWHVFCYVYEGEILIGRGEQQSRVAAGNLVHLGDGNVVEIYTGKQPAGFLFVGAQPINEPIVRSGPFVMNQPEELQQAFMDYQNGTLAPGQ